MTFSIEDAAVLYGFDAVGDLDQLAGRDIGISEGTTLDEPPHRYPIMPTGFAFQLKSGRTSAPRLPQMERDLRHERTESGVRPMDGQTGIRPILAALHGSTMMTSNTPKSSRRDHLTTTTDACKIELTEHELSRVAGGAKFNDLKIVAFGLKHWGVDFTTSKASTAFDVCT